MGFGVAQRIHVDQPAAHLERANRRMVLMLDNDNRADTLCQQRPCISGRGWHERANTGGRIVKLIQSEKRHNPAQRRCRNTTKCDSEKLTMKLVRIATALASQTGSSRIWAANNKVAVFVNRPAIPETTKVK